MHWHKDVILKKNIKRDIRLCKQNYIIINIMKQIKQENINKRV